VVAGDLDRTHIDVSTGIKNHHMVHGLTRCNKAILLIPKDGE